MKASDTVTRYCSTCGQANKIKRGASGACARCGNAVKEVGERRLAHRIGKEWWLNGKVVTR